MRNGQAVFDQAISSLHQKVRKDLDLLSNDLKTSAQEIRLIAGFPPQVMASNKLTDIAGDVITKKDLNDCMLSLCKGSIHSHQKELSAGFLSLEGGHRAAFAATAVYGTNGIPIGFRNLTAIVIRIAGDHRGVSIPLIKRAFCDGLCGLMIAGAPSSGKTTILRDIARQLSCGALNGCDRVAVIDERGELGSCNKSLVLKGYDKAQGMLMALRLLSPQVILCDEIGELSEAKAVLQALNSGVYVITTVHAASKEQLLNRTVSKELLLSRAFKRTAILSDKPAPCSIKEVFDNDELIAEADRHSIYNAELFCLRNNKSRPLFNEDLFA